MNKGIQSSVFHNHSVLRARAKITSHFYAPMHPTWLRCERAEISRYSCTFAPCQTGASTPENANIAVITNFELPEIKLDHLKALTDDTGILQHVTYTIPHRTHGYCTDGNARALLVAAMGQKYLSANGLGLDRLSGHYLGFLLYAYNEENGRFRNFMTYSRQRMEQTGSEDAHGALALKPCGFCNNGDNCSLLQF
ncbi:MAG: hypothetical protein ACFFD6_11770 [Candidatus Thorarchaeota archaeon]